MLVQHVKELIAKGSINCIFKSQYQDNAFRSAEDLNFENFSFGSTMVGLIVNSGYERMSRTFSLNSA